MQTRTARSGQHAWSKTPRAILRARVAVMQTAFRRHDARTLASRAADRTASREERLYADYLLYRLGSRDALQAYADEFPLNRLDCEQRVQTEVLAMLAGSWGEAQVMGEGKDEGPCLRAATHYPTVRETAPWPSRLAEQ